MSITRQNVGPVMSQVVEHNGVVYLAGLTADDSSGDIQDQTRQILDKIDALLAKGGTDKSRLLTCLIFVTDIRNRPAMNEIYTAWIDKANPPTRACVESNLAGNTLVEIVVTAAK